MSQLWQAIFSGLALGALYSAVGIGFVVIHRVTHVVNLAQGVITVLGAYLMSELLPSMSWAPALILSGLAAAVAAALVGAAVLSARNAFAYSPIIMTLGIAFAGQGLFVLGWGEVPVSYSPISMHAYRWLGAFVLPQQVLLFGIVIVLLVLLQAFFSTAYLGKALSAAAMNPRSAQLAGVNLFGAGIAAFVVAGFIGGISGGVAGALTPVTPEFHIELAVAGFVAAVFGDLDRPIRTMVGGVLLGIVTSFAATYGFPKYQQVVALSALLVLLFARTVWARRGGVLS
jgi:branched-chain amino acid transport system permease protein